MREEVIDNRVMSSLPGAVTVQEYLRTVYRPDCEYVDGAVLERNMGEKGHSKAQGGLYFYLHQRRGELGICVFVEQRIRISGTRYRVPDICVIAGPEPDEEIFTAPPFLCIEVLSPEDRMSRMQERIGDYLGAGVRYVWVVDPQSHRGWIYTAGQIQEAAGGVLRTQDPEIVVPLDAIFS